MTTKLSVTKPRSIVIYEAINFKCLNKEEKMRKKLWISLALAFVIPGLLFTVACGKKEVVEEEVVVVEVDDSGCGCSVGCFWSHLAVVDGEFFEV